MNGTSVYLFQLSLGPITNRFLALALLVMAQGAFAVDVTWVGNGGGVWTEPDEDIDWSATYDSGYNVTFDDSATGTLSVTNTVPVHPGSVTVNNTNKNYTILASIAGTCSVTKLGSGTLTLSGTNTFTGNLYIKAGTLNDQLGGNVGDTRNWGAPTAIIYLGDATVGANATLATSCNAGYSTLPSSINPIVVVSGGGARTIRVQAGVTAQGWIGGNITLNNNLQFIYDNGGGRPLKIGTTNSNITGTGNLTFASTTGNSTFLLTSVSINPVGAITNNNLSTGTNTISGNIGANVTGVTQNSATSALILSGTNTYSGPTIVSQGLLTVSKVVSLPTNSPLTVASNAFVNLSGNTQTVVSVSGSGMVSNGWLKVTSAMYPGGSNTIGTLTIPNLTLAENSTIYYDYLDGATDTNLVLGSAILPANATVRVSGSGKLPATSVLFYVNGTNFVSGIIPGWTVSGIDGWNLRVRQQSNEIQLLALPKGTIVSIR